MAKDSEFPYLDAATAELDIDPISTSKLSKDLKLAATNLSGKQARYLVDLYYQVQDARMAFFNQVRKTEEGASNEFLFYAGKNMEAMEKTIVKAMSIYTDEQEVSRWAKSIYGIGPILAAGLVARITLEKTFTAGGIWRFCGLDPTVTWNKGERCPWNRALKVHAWRIGSSFWKFHNRPECFYGRLIAERKEKEIQKNLAGAYAELAEKTLTLKNFKDKATIEIYKSGRLPDGRIHARAQRWGVKLFLSHWFHVFLESNGRAVPIPYAQAHLKEQHPHYIPPPNWPRAEKAKV